MHRLLLRLYPASFRNEYGEELRRVFARRRREAGGPIGVVLLWLGEIADVVTTAVFSAADHVLVRPLPYAEPDRLVKIWESQPTLIDLRDEVNAKSRQMLTALMAAAGCVLLIACTNLASLLVARMSSREREMAVRAALGAGREHLVRQLMTESLLLAVVGGLAGLVVAQIVVPLVVTLVPTNLPIGEGPTLDLRMLAIVGAMTLTTGIGFGVLPAFRMSRQAARSAPTEALRAD